MNKTATTIPFDPDSTKFPKRKDVPRATYSPPGVETAWVWGESDMVIIVKFILKDLILMLLTDWPPKSPHAY